MRSVVFLVASGIVAAAVAYVAWLVLGALRKYRGVRVITCPENKEHAAVEVDATQAAITAGFGETLLQLKSCSRWPERAGCGQMCLSQIEASPQDCLLRTILTKWYAGKSCVHCAKPLGEIDWIEHKPALRSLEGRTVEWHEVRPEQVYATLATHQPVCWNCHVAESFRRQHPELVIERPGH